MLAAVICREFGWTWEEFWDQPQPFIETIVDMMEAEAKEAKRASKKGGP